MSFSKFLPNFLVPGPICYVPQPLDAIVPSARLAPLVAGGLLVRDATGLRATAAGLQVLNGVLARLL